MDMNLKHVIAEVALKEDFDRVMKSLRRVAAKAPRAGDAAYNDRMLVWAMGQLTMQLLECDPAWADDALLSILGGQHGDRLQESLARKLVIGPTNDNRAKTATDSFLSQCLVHRRLELFVRVAESGLPARLEFEDDDLRRGATTTGGRWLDHLANAVLAPVRKPFAAFLDSSPTSFAAPMVAELIVKLDPDHAAIAAIAKPEALAHLTAARMRAKLSNIAPTRNDALPRAPAARRAPL